MAQPRAYTGWSELRNLVAQGDAGRPFAALEDEHEVEHRVAQGRWHLSILTAPVGKYLVQLGYQVPGARLQLQARLPAGMGCLAQFQRLRPQCIGPLPKTLGTSCSLRTILFSQKSSPLTL